jgi:NTE family protein
MKDVIETKTTQAPKPRIAVVIGAVGVRGVAAIPLFEFLDEEKIEVDLLIATGGGALAAAMRGAGFSTAHMREVAAELQRENPYTQIDYRTLLGFAHPKLSRPGIDHALKRTEELRALYRRIFGDRRLEDFEPATILQTSDCVQGKSVLLSKGPTADAVYAAGALPPEFPPVQIEGQWLLDGSFISPVPIMEAIKRQADIILALFYEETPKPDPADLLEANFNILAAYIARLSRDQMMLSIEMHHHEILMMPLKLDPYVGPWENAAIPRVLEAGREVVSRNAEEILNLVHNYAVTE